MSICLAVKINCPVRYKTAQVYVHITVSRFNYIDKIITKDRSFMPLDLNIILFHYKFSQQATVDHLGNSVHCGHYTASVTCCGKHSIAMMIELRNALSLLTDWVCHLYLFVLRLLNDRERYGLWWPAAALSGRWLSCTGCRQLLLNMKCLMYGLLFLHLSTFLGCFCPETFFLQNGLDCLLWNFSIYYLYTELRMISRCVSGSATNSPCAVWGLGWTTCLPCGGPILAWYL